jgi:nitrate reductase delta subunit
VTTAVVCQAASVLLCYPDSTVRAQLPQVHRAVQTLPTGTPRDRLLSFTEYALAADPRTLEEHYVTVFDRKRRCCLYLTWWTDGETRRRGLSLARLKSVYRDHGLVLDGGELPDFLPVMLEFTAATGNQLVGDHRAGLELLRLALVELDTPYVAPVEAVCALLPGPSPQDVAAARALARSGPPTEEVGLAPYPTGSADLGPTSLRPTGGTR